MNDLEARPTKPSASPPAAVALAGVVHRWRGRGPRVLDGIDLSLPAGSLTWLSGPNGAGKTTLLRILGAIIEPESGSVHVCGIDARSGDRRLARQVTFLPAGNGGLYARLTPRQHLELWARIAYVPKAQRAARVEGYLDLLSLRELAGSRVDRISAGQRQRVRLATALLAQAPLTLLDEPRNSLDGAGQAAMARALAQASAAGRSVIWCAPEGEDPGMPYDHALRLHGGQLESGAA